MKHRTLVNNLSLGLLVGLMGLALTGFFSGNVAAQEFDKNMKGTLVEESTFTGAYYSLAQKRSAASNAAEVLQGWSAQLPDLTGSWDMWVEAYGTPGGYVTGYTLLVITEQTGGVFTGYSQHPPSPDVEYLNGALLGKEIRITDTDAIVTGILVNENTIVGTFSTIATEPGVPPYDKYGAGRFIALRVIE